LREGQISPPPYMDEMERVLWKERSKILYTRISGSLHHTIRKVADSYETKCPVTIWKALNDEFGISKAEERLELMRSLRELKVQSNDYPEYLQKYRTIWRELRAMKATIEDFEHDNFIIGLGDH
jgi:hypothetical protein